MQVHRIYTFSELRNFSYIIDDGLGGCFCVDPFDAEQIDAMLSKLKLKLNGIINTHEHWDHTQGNKELVKRYNCPVYGPLGSKNKIQELTEELAEGHRFVIGGGFLEIINIPGHTFSHLGILAYSKKTDLEEKPIAFFSGDTLFNAAVGRCGNGGDPEILYETIIKKIAPLNNNILLYPGHDYYENNLRFTLSLQEDNDDAKLLLERFMSNEIETTNFTTDLAMEKKINLFFNLKDKTIREKLGLINNTDKDVFLELRRLRDKW